MDDLITSSLPTAALVEEEKSEEQKAQEYEQKQDDYHLAALIEHPGWKQIAELMRKDIADARALKGINMATCTDKELGEIVRGEYRLAQRLDEYLSKVEEAVKAVAISNGRTGTE